MTAPAKGPARLRAPLPSEEETLLPRVGKIRLGVQATSQGGKLYPKAIDWFRVEHEESEITSDAAVQAFRSVYGDQPRELAVMFPGHDLEDVLEHAYRLYGASKLKRRCDGETCSERTATGGWVTKPCVCATLPEKVPAKRGDGLVANPDLCKRTLTIQVLLPDVSGIGVWQIDTSSEIGMRRLVGHLRLILGIRGTLQGYECKLGLVPVKVAPDGVSKTVYVLDPRDYSQTPRQALESAGQAREQLDAAARLALPAPSLDDERDPLLHPDESEPDVRQLVGEQITKRLLADDQAYIRDRFAAKLGAAVDALIGAYGEDDEIGPLLAENLAAALVLIREREDPDQPTEPENGWQPKLGEDGHDPDDEIPF